MQSERYTLWETVAVVGGIWLAIFGAMGFTCGNGGDDGDPGTCDGGPASNPDEVESGDLQVQVGRWAGGGLALQPSSDVSTADGTSDSSTNDGGSGADDASDTDGTIADAMGGDTRTDDASGTDTAPGDAVAEPTDVDGGTESDAETAEPVDVGGDTVVADPQPDGGDTYFTDTWGEDAGPDYSNLPAPWKGDPDCESDSSCSGFVHDPDYPIHRGGQGGVHIFPVIRVQNVDSEDFTADVRYELLDMDGNTVSTGKCVRTEASGWEDTDNGWVYHGPRLVILGNVMEETEHVLVVDVEIGDERKVVRRRVWLGEIT